MTDKFHGRMALLCHFPDDNEYRFGVDYAHRDDYYIFIFIEKGDAGFLIDFEERRMKDNTVHCILPGQVHFPSDSYDDINGWFLMVDSLFVTDEYKEIFENKSLIKSEITLNRDAADDLRSCVSILHRRMKSEEPSVNSTVVRSLLSSCIGMIAEIYQSGFPVTTANRPAAITAQFKSLLTANYQSLKSPSGYAAKLNVSEGYLNEVIKKTTGLSVSDNIRNEIVMQAKRLLFYTDMTVKETALTLGYEDWAYFTRLFTKTSRLSPTQFRQKYLK